MLNIIIKVARGKSIINFKFFNHKVDRAVTMKELMKKVSTNKYDLVLFEEIDEHEKQKIENISSIVKTALVCGREKEYAKQVELANSIGRCHKAYSEKKDRPYDVCHTSAEESDHEAKHSKNYWNCRTKRIIKLRNRLNDRHHRSLFHNGIKD